MSRQINRRVVLSTCGLVMAKMAGCLRLSTSDQTQEGGDSTSDQTQEGGDSTSDQAGEDETTAVFEYSPGDPYVGERVTFDGSASSAATGEIVDYRWGLIYEDNEAIQPIGSGKRVSHQFGSGGDYVVGLEVFDENGNGDRTKKTLTVSGDISEIGDTLTFEWGEVAVPAEDGGGNPEDERSLAFACRTLSIIGDDKLIKTFNIGGETEPLFGEGVYSPESTDEYTFRWFGSPEKRTRLAFPDMSLSEATAVRLEGRLATDRQEVSLSLNGNETDSKEITNQENVFEFSTTN